MIYIILIIILIFVIGILIHKDNLEIDNNQNDYLPRSGYKKYL